MSLGATLVQRTHAFEAALKECLDPSWSTAMPLRPRHRVVVAACRLSIDHAASARHLLLQFGASASGAALIRLQYEALLRAAWAQFVATETQIEKLVAPLSDEAERAAKSLPGPQEMLERLGAFAPRGVREPLQAFHAASWRALNSYVHAGLHPLVRTIGSFPEALAEQLVVNSNGLLHLAYRMLASFSGQACMDDVTALHEGFADCLPALTP